VQGMANISFHAIEGAGHFFSGHMDQMQAALLEDMGEAG